MPPQLRLPAERLPGPRSVVIRKPRPNLSRPSATKVKSRLRGSADASAGTDTLPMWFWPMSATVSALSTRAPSKLAAIEQHAHEAAVVAGSRGQSAAADRLRDG